MTIKLKQLLHTANEDTLQTHDLDGENDQGLATAGYGLTDGGVWVPQRVTDDGDTRVQNTGSIVEINETIEVDSGESEVLTITPDDDGIYQIFIFSSEMRLEEDKNSGSLSLEFGMRDNFTGYRHSHKIIGYNLKDSERIFEVFSAIPDDTVEIYTSQSEEISIQNSLYSYCISKDNPLYVEIDNSTDQNMSSEDSVYRKLEMKLRRV